jgi:hypothetical protein
LVSVRQENKTDREAKHQRCPCPALFRALTYKFFHYDTVKLIVRSLSSV